MASRYQNMWRKVKFDQETGTTFWHDAIAKEMKMWCLLLNSVMTMSCRLDTKRLIVIWYLMWTWTSLVRLGWWLVVIRRSFRRSPRLVLSYLMTQFELHLQLPRWTINILACDVQNAYLNAPTKEKVYTIARREIGTENEGHPVLIVCALYGLHSSCAQFREHARCTIATRYCVFLLSCRSWRLAATSYEDYAYVHWYVDNLPVLSHSQPRRRNENLIN